VCKPHKRGWDTRWKPKEAAQLKRFERDRQHGWRGDYAWPATAAAAMARAPAHRATMLACARAAASARPSPGAARGNGATPWERLSQ